MLKKDCKNSTYSSNNSKDPIRAANLIISFKNQLIKALFIFQLSNYISYDLIDN